MAGARSLQLGLELVAHDAMQGLIGSRQGTLLPEPGLERHGAAETRGRREPRLALGADGGRQRCLPRGCPRVFVVQARFSAAVSILAEPARDGRAVDGKMVCRLAPRYDLPRFEEDQQMPARPQ